MNNIQAINQVIESNEQTYLNAKKLPSFKVSVKRYFTNVDGTIVNKLSGIVPTFARTKYPVFLFNAFDNSGGYFQGLKALPLDDGLFFISNFSYGNSFDLLNFSGGNNVKEKLTIGDQILLFSDSEQYPNFFVWVVISSELRSYASILHNPLAQGLSIHSLKFFADDLTQFQESISYVNQDELGNVEKDDFVPQTFKTVDYQQEGFILIPFNGWKLTNYRGLYFNMLFDSNQIDLIFRYIKP